MPDHAPTFPPGTIGRIGTSVPSRWVQPRVRPDPRPIIRSSARKLSVARIARSSARPSP